MKEFVKPYPFAAYVDCDGDTIRLGQAKTLELARKMCKDHDYGLKHPNTYGGLIDFPKDKGGRTYRIFQALEWIEMKV